MSMARTPKKRRAAGTEATRRWRERRAQGRRLVTIEVAETTLARLAEQGLLSITNLDDSVALGLALTRILNEKISIAGSVSDHARARTQPTQDIETGDLITENAGAIGSDKGLLSGTSPLQQRGRDARGCWVRGVSGNPAGKRRGTRNASSAELRLLCALLEAASRRD
jgi:hypothetical protein